MKFKKTFAVLFSLTLMICTTGFAIVLKPNKGGIKPKVGVLECEKQYVYVGNDKKENIIIKTIHQDETRIIEIMQLNGHEYIVYIHRWKASIAMVHSKSCHFCKEQKN